MRVGIDDGLCTQCTDGGTNTVCHQHEQTLRRGTDGRVGGFIHKQRTGDVEEVEGNAIDNHGKYEHPHAAARITQSEQTETKHPCEHGNEHHLLDAVALHEERNEQDAAGF